MPTQKEHKLSAIQSILLAAIIGLAGFLLSKISDDFFAKVESAISYKTLLIASILILLVWAYVVVTNLIDRPISNQNIVVNSNPEDDSQKNDYASQKELEEAEIKSLSYLSKDEKELLKEYFDKDTKTLRKSLLNGTANGLKSKGILYMPSSVGRYDSFSYNIQDWAWIYLKEHPNLLK